MKPRADRKYIAFDGNNQIAQGEIFSLAPKAKKYLDKNPKASILIFDAEDSALIEVDFRGTVDNVTERLEAYREDEAKVGPGRPKLGVVSKEVGLLPRHWEWLALQPGGASATLRNLVEAAQKKNLRRDQIRRSQDATYKFMHALAGDLPLYEEVLRALYAKNENLFKTLIAPWPNDLRKHVIHLATPTFEGESSEK